MARFRQISLRGPSPIFKKRFVRFSTIIQNSLPGEIVQIKLAETGTIMACKISLAAIPISAVDPDVQELNMFLYCDQDLDDPAFPNPSITPEPVPYNETPEVDSINGFHVGNIWVNRTDGTIPLRMNTVQEKFRFRRKCDRNMVIRLTADSIVRNGAARSVLIFGTMYLTIKTR